MPWPRKTLVFLLLICAVIGSPAPIFARTDSPSLAIFNFRAETIDALMYNSEILYTLLSALEREKGVKVISRRKMEATLSQNNLAQSDHPEIIIQAGQVLGADFILFGSVAQKTNLVAHLKLMDIARRHVARTWNLRFKKDETVLERMSVVAKQLTATILKAQPANSGQSKTDSAASAIISNIRVQSVGDQIILTWESDSIHPVQAFHIYRGVRSDGAFQRIGQTTEKRFVDENFESGGAYYYRIGTVLQSGREIRGEETAKIEKAGERLPYPPLIMSSHGGVRQAEIKFVPALQNMKANFDIVTYNVYRHDAAKDQWAPLKAIRKSASKLVFTIQDRQISQDGAAFRYALTSVDRQGRESPRSDSITVQTAPVPSLEMIPNDLPKQIDLAWKPIEHVDGYNLYRAPSGDAEKREWVKIAQIEDPGTQKYTDPCTDELDGVAYLYRITAYDDETGETAPSTVVEARCGEPPEPRELTKSNPDRPQPPIGSELKQDDTDAADDQNPLAAKPQPLKSQPENSQDLEEKPDSGESAASETGYIPKEPSSDAVSDDEPFVSPGSETEAESEKTTGESSSPNDLVALLGAPVLGVSRDNQLRQIDLVWRKVENADGYHLFRKSEKMDWRKIATITDPDARQYSDTTDLEDGQTYQYYLTAYNAHEETEPSPQVSAQTKPPPSYPKDIKAFRQDHKVKITWTPLNDPDVGGYVIFRGAAAKNKQSVPVEEIAEVEGWQSNFYIDQGATDLEPGREYYYAIKSYNLFKVRGALSEAVRAKRQK